MLEEQMVRGTVPRVASQNDRVLILNGCLRGLGYPVKQKNENDIFQDQFLNSFLLAGQSLRLA